MAVLGPVRSPDKRRDIRVREPIPRVSLHSPGLRWLQLHEVPTVSIKIFEHRNDPILFFAWFLAE